MTRVLIVVAAVLGATAMGGWLWLQDRSTDRAIADADILAQLPPRAFAAMITLPTGAADLVMFQDGDTGWFELDATALPPDTSIGFHGPRLFDIFTGNEHVPLYCSGNTMRAGKIIWVVESGRIARDFAFCNPRRMDLSPLRPAAHPVALIEDYLTRAAFDDMAQDIASDPTRALVSHPEDHDWARHTHRVTITLPLMWLADDAGLTRWQLQDRIAAAVTRTMGDVDLRFRQRDGVARNPSFELDGSDQGGRQGRITGMGLVTDDVSGLLPEMQAIATRLVIDCAPEVCARATDVALRDVIAPARDVERLRTAMAQIVPDPTGPERGTAIGWPGLADLEDDALTVSDPAPITYLVRTIRRLPTSAP